MDSQDVDWKKHFETLQLYFDCSRDREVSVWGTRTALHQYEVYSVAEFIRWDGYLADGLLLFKSGLDTLYFDFMDSTFFKEQLRANERRIMYHADTTVFNQRTIGPIPKNLYSLIWTYVLDLDTQEFGRCIGTRHRLLAITGATDTFKSKGRINLNPDEFTKANLIFVCPYDSTMYGIFRDKKSGEELKIATDRTVHYRSKNRPEWRMLYSTFDPGWLRVGFSSTDRIEYQLYFTNGEWLLTPNEPNQAPQHFVRISDQ